jgi:hypothetical protein
MKMMFGNDDDIDDEVRKENREENDRGYIIWFPLPRAMGVCTFRR